VRVGGHVRALLREARVRGAFTQTNWEGHRRVPDIRCEPAEALRVASDATSA
jgi:hypothetical protein